LLFDQAPPPFTDLCLKAPGYEVELTISSDLRMLIVVWMGEISITKGMWDKRVTVTGSSFLKKNMAVCVPAAEP
jgi:putative sterol carrier protein